MRKITAIILLLVFIFATDFIGNLVAAEEANLPFAEAITGIEIVKRDGVLYFRNEAGCWWMQVGALDRYPIEWSVAGKYLLKHLNMNESKRTCTQSSIWVVADSARQTRPVYLKDKKVGDIAIGARCFGFVRYSSFNRQYRYVHSSGGSYALCEVKFVHLLAGSIN